MLKRNLARILITLVLLVPATTHAGFWSTITGWFSSDDTVYVAPSTPVAPPPEPEVLTEETSVPAPTQVQKPSTPTYTPPVTTTPSPVSFIGGVTLQQLNDALKKLEDRLEPQIERAMDSPRPRGEVSNQSSHALPEGTDGYILQSDGDDDVIWVSPASLTVTGDGTFSTTSADHWFTQQVISSFSTTSANAWLDTLDTDDLTEGTNLYYTDARVATYVSSSSTVPHAGNATLGDVLYWDGSAWTALATSSLNIGGSGGGTDVDVDNNITIESAAKVGSDLGVRIGDADVDANSDCIARDTTYGLYHDTNCDGDRDAGETILNLPLYTTLTLTSFNGTDNANTQISWETEVIDEAGLWTAGTPTRITPIITGWYHFEVFCDYPAVSGTYFLSISRNGLFSNGNIYSSNGTVSNVQVSTSADFYLTTSDYVVVWSFVNSSQVLDTCVFTSSLQRAG